MQSNGHGRIGLLENPRLQTEDSKTYRKVAIIGKAPDSMALAPYDDDSWELWGLSNVYAQVPRLTRSYELHDFEAGWERWPEDYKRFLAGEHPFPIYGQKTTPLAPNVLPFPLADIEAEFKPLMPDGHRLYVNNSVSWIALHAMLEGVNELAFYGVNMAQHGIKSKSEYAHQRPSCEFWLGVAIGRGIKVHLPIESDLLKVGCLYGFETHGVMRHKLDIRYEELLQRKRKAEAEIERRQQEALVLHGAIEDLEYVKQWIQDDGIDLGTKASNSR